MGPVGDFLESPSPKNLVQWSLKDLYEIFSGTNVHFFGMSSIAMGSVYYSMLVIMNEFRNIFYQ